MLIIIFCNAEVIFEDILKSLIRSVLSGELWTTAYESLEETLAQSCDGIVADTEPQKEEIKKSFFITNCTVYCKCNIGIIQPIHVTAGHRPHLTMRGLET